MGTGHYLSGYTKHLMVRYGINEFLTFDNGILQDFDFGLVESQCPDITGGYHGGFEAIIYTTQM